MYSRLPNCRYFNDQQLHSMLPRFIFSGWGRGDWVAGGGDIVFIHVSSDRRVIYVFPLVNTSRENSIYTNFTPQTPYIPASRHKLRLYRHHATSSVHTGITPQAPSIPHHATSSTHTSITAQAPSIPASRHKLHTYWHHVTNSLPIPASYHKLHPCRYYATSSTHTGNLPLTP